MDTNEKIFLGSTIGIVLAMAFGVIYAGGQGKDFKTKCMLSGNIPVHEYCIKPNSIVEVEK